MNEKKIIIKKNGPYMVKGGIPLYTIENIIDENGYPIGYSEKKLVKTGPNYALCRCGQSKNKPFCDGTHIAGNFDGREIAKVNDFSNNLQNFETEKYELIDSPIMCDHSKFCLRAGGIRNLMVNGDDESIAIAKEEAKNCPSGRLTLVDKDSDYTSEEKYEKEIILIYDNNTKKNGQIWVRGGIPVIGEDDEGNEKKYEVRNRVTLCRCSNSEHKPFCDGTHWVSSEFKANFREKWNLD
ncbi:MAG: CDGSH iron-sulfur domain-containing protein [Methanobrevibacter sp.]|jgi:CDGSH-type Zn-finger protein|nr:CDGSH iron-sulfur domain-containing protein [Candidatus Methanoflexus mossambicus]